MQYDMMLQYYMVHYILYHIIHYITYDVMLALQLFSSLDLLLYYAASAQLM